MLERIWRVLDSIKSLFSRKQRTMEAVDAGSQRLTTHDNSQGATIRENEIATLDESALALREAEQILQRTPYLRHSLAPILATFIRHGLRGRRLEGLLAVIGTDSTDAHSRSGHILRALRVTYTAEELMIAGKDDSQYELLLEHVKKGIGLKYDCSLNDIFISHETSLKIIRRYGDEAIIHIQHMVAEDIDPQDMGMLLKRIMNSTQDFGANKKQSASAC